MRLLPHAARTCLRISGGVAATIFPPAAYSGRLSGLWYRWRRNLHACCRSDAISAGDLRARGAALHAWRAGTLGI